MELSLEEVIQEGLDLRTVKEWAEELNFSRAAIGNWIEQDYIDYVDIRGRKHVVLTYTTKDFKGKRHGS